MAELESKEDKVYKKQRRFSQEQYEMLKRCSEKRPEGIKEWNEWRKQNPNEDILLEGADIRRCYLKGAYLNTGGFREDETRKFVRFDGQVYLQGANLRHAYLEGAKLYGAHLERVDFVDCRLQGTSLSRACLQGALFETAVVDGETAIWQTEIDVKTDFTGVGLANARIDPATKQLLEYNIRRKNWEDWYKEHALLQWPVWLFWLISDYGLRTWRIIVTFFALAFIFANIYYHWGRISPPGIVDNLFVDRSGVGVAWWLVPVRALYFSIITMTLGFSDMYANARSIWAHILITIQALFGYVLLGALVTRFAVLFTAGGPAGKFADQKEKKNETE